MTENKFLYETLWRIYEPDMPQFISQLAETNPMQRLKQVGMNCGCEYVALHSKDMCRRYTRFEHSIGVALIIWHFTHHPQQAVAGLFHDISTPAFAHVVDFLNGDHLTQESTEQPTFDMIDQSPEIQTILGDLGLSTADVSNYHLFPIADNSSPQLSADRLEYTLGNFALKGNLHTVWRTVMGAYSPQEIGRITTNSGGPANVHVAYTACGKASHVSRSLNESHIETFLCSGVCGYDTGRGAAVHKDIVAFILR